MKSKITNYSPTLFLSALGLGGLSVSFFMYLMFIIPRNSEKFPIPNFETLMQAWNLSNIFYQITIIVGIIGIVYFAIKHIQYLIWNIKEFIKFKKNNDYIKFLNGENEVSLMTIPLTFAMSVNVLFILGAILIPNLWNIVEYLFPLALLAFGVIGIFAMKIFLNYFVKIILKKSKSNFVNTNNLSSMISVFAFVMIGVGFSASTAMSTNKTTIFIGLIGSIFFITIGLFLLIIKTIFGFKAILENGIEKQTSPSLWIFIPILTLIGITIIRQTHGLHDFGLHFSNGTYIIITFIILSLQIFFGILGYKVMKENGYFQEYINGKEISAVSYALICPGVALTVFGFFVLNIGIIKNGLINKFGIVYFIILISIIVLQFFTIKTIFKLNRKIFVK